LRPGLAESLTYLFGGAAFIAPDAFFKTTNAGAQEKHGGYPDRRTSGGPYLLI